MGFRSRATRPGEGTKGNDRQFRSTIFFFFGAVCRVELPVRRKQSRAGLDFMRQSGAFRNLKGHRDKGKSTSFFNSADQEWGLVATCGWE